MHGIWVNRENLEYCNWSFLENF